MVVLKGEYLLIHWNSRVASDLNARSFLRNFIVFNNVFIIFTIRYNESPIDIF